MEYDLYFLVLYDSIKIIFQAVNIVLYKIYSFQIRIGGMPEKSYFSVILKKCEYQNSLDLNG